MSNRPHPDQPIVSGAELAGSWPLFPDQPGSQLVTALPIDNFPAKRLIFNQIDKPGQVHIFKTDCRAGERLRVQTLVPVLARGKTALPAVALVGQGLPYSTNAQKLPIELPQGYSAIVAPAPSQLTQPVEDILTRARYYPGPVIDTRTLVGGTCYLLVWSPDNQMGNYVIQTGHRWPLRVTYWVSIPRIWWQIRGWFGLGRSGVVGALAGITLVGLLALWMSKKR